MLPNTWFVAQAAHTMQVVGDDESIPPAVQDFDAVLQRNGYGPTHALERFVFYDRAAKAFAIVATGETRMYGNIVLKKGVVRS